LFALHPSKKKTLTRKLTLKIDSAASTGGQGKLTYFMYFPSPSLEGELTISTLSFLFTSARKL
jgi:hypothetical protein